jgi:hypothetical protein
LVLWQPALVPVTPVHARHSSGTGRLADESHPDSTVQLFEDGLAAPEDFFVGYNLLQVPIGETIELVLDLLGGHVIIALDRLASPAEASLHASLTASVLPSTVSPLRALALRFLLVLPLFGAELLPGFLGQVTLLLTIIASLRLILPYCHSSSVHCSRRFWSSSSSPL